MNLVAAPKTSRAGFAREGDWGGDKRKIDPPKRNEAGLTRETFEAGGLKKMIRNRVRKRTRHRGKRMYYCVPPRPSAENRVSASEKKGKSVFEKLAG